ncbi:MAG: NADH-quinone oxidoreductase subunit L [Acidimicrobiia bacterium]|nr:NADH-quinone oxidoreductase subunit L [Acidimicrobiia bacterium]
MLRYAWIIAFIPALSFFLILFFGKRMPKGGSEIGIAALGASFVLSVVAAVQWIDKVESTEGGEGGHALGALGQAFHVAGEAGHTVVEPVLASVSWFTLGGVDIRAGTMIDGLSVMMLFVVSLVSLLVHIYSTSYMEGDRRYTYFFAALSLFSASMLTLVIAGSTLLLLVGWELVGLCSFMLIGHWWEEGANSDAALKAFFTTRTGDIGLIIGIVILFFGAGGTFDIPTINEMAVNGEMSQTVLTTASVALLIGIIGKSGQFPLHTWLPDAMAGPTPVSALIHAATMVVAGVFLGARLYPVFFEGFHIADGGLNAMAVIGGITVIIGAALAFVQNDIKKVLAYSTISQIGYMVMALGVGAWLAAVFHLFTHAFFKADLFLGSGSVSHAVHTFDMRKMGGLRKVMPHTFWTFIISSLALAGFFPLAGFWSKDEIINTAGKADYDFFLVVGLVGAFMTAAYMTRCVWLTFFGEYRGAEHPHESPKAILVPLWILAIGAVFAGFLNATAFDIHKFTEWVEPTSAFPEVIVPEFSVPLAVFSFMVAAAGVAVAGAYYVYGMGPRGLTERNASARAGYTFLENKYYLDHLYTDLVVGSIKGPIARGTYWFNQNVIDGVVNAAGTGTRRVGRFTYDVIDQKIVDGSVNEIAAATDETGGLLRYLQSGRVQRYALILFASVGVLSLALVFAN